MAVCRRTCTSPLVNAGASEETAGKLAAAGSKLDLAATLIAAREAIGKVRKWQQTVDEGCREMLAKDKPAIDDDRYREKGKVLMVCADRGSGPGQRRYRVNNVGFRGGGGGGGGLMLFVPLGRVLLAQSRCT